MHYLPFATTVFTFAFAIAVFSRYLKRHGTHLLIWSIGLVFYGLATLGEILLGFSFTGFVLKIWYLGGAMLSAAWLGEGTIHLLVKKRGVARALTILLTAVSVLAAVLIFAAPLTSAAASYNVQQPISSQYKDILVRSGLITLLTILLNSYGTLVLVGGAIYSAVNFARKHILVNRMIGNIFIAVGAMAPAAAGSFVTMGLPDLLYLSELIGAVLMYIGFMLATRSSTHPA